MEADLQKALEASRAERKAWDDWQSRYADMERQIAALSVPAAPLKPARRSVWRFGIGVAVGIGVGVAVGVAIARWLV